MEATIARLNIQRFRKKLSEQQDEGQRKILLKLLAEEEKKLESIGQSLEERATADAFDGFHSRNCVKTA